MSKLQVVISLLVVCVTVVQSQTANPAPKIDPLPTALKNIKAEKAVLFDVRELSEWNESHFKGAKHLALSKLKKLAAADAKKLMPEGKIVYLHCAVGGRAGIAANILKRIGIDARPIKSSFEDIAAAGVEQVKPQPDAK